MARLLGRRQGPLQTAMFQYAPGCALTTTHSARSIRFGVNDTPEDAQRLRPDWTHGYWVRIFFGTVGEPKYCRSDVTTSTEAPPHENQF